MNGKARQLILGMAMGILGVGSTQAAVINFGGIDMQTSGSVIGFEGEDAHATSLTCRAIRRTRYCRVIGAA